MQHQLSKNLLYKYIIEQQCSLNICNTFKAINAFCWKCIVFQEIVVYLKTKSKNYCYCTNVYFTGWYLFFPFSQSSKVKLLTLQTSTKFHLNELQSRDSHYDVTMLSMSFQLNLRVAGVTTTLVIQLQSGNDRKQLFSIFLELF